MTATIADPIAIPTVRLPVQEVHVWQAHLDRAPISELAQTLSEEEMSRAERYRFSVDRHRSIAARGILREILSSYLGTPPAAITFNAGSFGKPYLSNFPVHFNLSHSGPMMLIALSHQELGIDLEKIDAPVEVMPIAQAYFPAAEAAELLNLSMSDRMHRFFQLWTNKEALAKASGLGIAQVLEPPAASPWTVRQIEAPSGYAAALALPKMAYTLHYRAWN